MLILKKGRFYSVGIGPGDPMLMTLLAVETIKKCDIIAVPKSGAAENIALKITREYLSGKAIVECDMPMTRDSALLAKSHEAAIAQIALFLDEGKEVAFLTLGDPSIYSTAMYVHNGLSKLQYTTTLIPGVPSFCAAAASLNVSLCEGKTPLHIIPASYSGSGEMLELSGSKVLMKSGKSIREIKEKLNANDMKAMAVECASMENEKVYHNIEDLREDSSYFSIILIKENEG